MADSADKWKGIQQEKVTIKVQWFNGWVLRKRFSNREP